MKMFSMKVMTMTRNILKNSNSQKLCRSLGFLAKTEYKTDDLHIVEDNGTVSVNGFLLSGYIAENRQCDKCNHFLIYNSQFDALFCPIDRTWCFPKCDDPECRYCSVRPDKPLPLGIDDLQYPKRNLKGLGSLKFIVIDQQEK